MSSKEIGIEEARKVLGDLVTAAQQGTSITITRNGRPAARLTRHEEPTVTLRTAQQVVDHINTWGGVNPPHSFDDWYTGMIEGLPEYDAQASDLIDDLYRVILRDGTEIRFIDASNSPSWLERRETSNERIHQYGDPRLGYSGWVVFTT